MMVHRHLAMRARDRLGIALTDRDVRYLVHQIQDGAATHVARRSKSRSVFLVQLRWKFFYAVYSAKNKTIVTVYPFHWKLPWN